MTVRINKSAFNIREKLSELERPIGLKGSELMRAETAQEAGSLLGVGRRNFIMNPKFDIDQRYGGSQINNTNGSKQLMDRWSTYTNLSNHSSNYNIVADAPTDAGIYRSVRITAAAASTYSTNQEYQFRQKFEGYDIKRLGWGTSGGKYSTVSFWVKSSIPGKYGLTAFFFGASSADRRYVAEYHINSANTWEYKTITIPPLTESINQVNYEANVSGMLMWSLGAHSNYQGTPGKWYSTYTVDPTGSVPFFATNGATFYLTGVQWELGKNATEFEHRSYGEELALCQRYYFKIKSEDADNAWYGSGFNYASTTAAGIVNFPVEMRIRPSTLEQSGTASDYVVWHGSNTSTNCSSVPTYAGATRTNCRVLFTVPSGLTIGQGILLRAANTNSYLAWSTEL